MRSAAGTVARPRAEPDGLGELAALFGVIRCDHWIIARQSPAFPVFVGSHVIRGFEMAFQHLELLAVLETDYEVGRDGFSDRDRRRWPFAIGIRAFADIRERLVNLLDQGRKVRHGDGIVRDMGGDNLGRQSQNLAVLDIGIAGVGH